MTDNFHPVECTINISNKDARIVAENADLMREIVRCCSFGRDIPQEHNPDGYVTGLTIEDMHLMEIGSIDQLTSIVGVMERVRLVKVDFPPQRPRCVTIYADADFIDDAYDLINSIAQSYHRAA